MGLRDPSSSPEAVVPGSRPPPQSSTLDCWAWKFPRAETLPGLDHCITDEDDCVQKCNVIAECNVICMREHPGITIRRYHHHPGLSLLERSPARPSTLTKLASRKA